jgi:hypothetical protein
MGGAGHLWWAIQVHDTIDIVLQSACDLSRRVVDHLPVAVPKHVWTYNVGPSRLVYCLTFREGTLAHIETGGYGHSRHGRRSGREEMMAMGLMWNDQVVELSGVPESDEATLNPYGLIGYELVAVTMVAATGRLVAYLKRGTLPEDDEAERA